MEKQLLGESLWRRGWNDTKAIWASWPFYVLDAVVAVIIGGFVGWYWGLAIVIFGMICVWMGATARAPIKQRNEARSYIATLQAEIAKVSKERDEAQSRQFAMPDELVAQTLRGLSIRIADLARESDIIRRKTFVDCHIYGPALIYPANSIVVHCQFDGRLEDTFVATTNDAVVGAIRLEDCTIRECSLHRIGFIGSPEEIKKAKENAQSP